MAKRSDTLIKQLQQALDQERGIDVGLLDEIKAHHINQLSVLQDEWKTRTAGIHNRVDEELAAVRMRGEAEIKDLNDMVSALTSVGKIVIDKIDAYMAKLNSSATVLELKPNANGVLPKVGAGDGNAIAETEKAAVANMAVK